MRMDLKKSFVTGLFATVPLFVSIGLLVWFFRTVDQFFSPPIDGFVQVLVPGFTHIPGTGILAGLVIILVVGLVARNVIGAKVLGFIEGLLNRIPGYRTVYSTVKNLTNAFSPDSARSFREVVFVDYPGPGSRALGFRTGSIVRGGEKLAVVFVPTNNLYLGDVIVVPKEGVMATGLTVEEGIRVILSAGTATPSRLPRQTLPPLPRRP